jgi:hypothetical protein
LLVDKSKSGARGLLEHLINNGSVSLLKTDVEVDIKETQKGGPFGEIIRITYADDPQNELWTDVRCIRQATLYK